MGCFFVFLVAVAAIFALMAMSGSDPITVRYSGGGLMRESCQWDAKNGRFLVSRFEGGISELVVTDRGFREHSVVDLDEYFEGNATLGIRVDPVRNRLLAVVADAWYRQRSALIAYDLTSWNVLFVAILHSPELSPFADDVAIDADGNAYVTDAEGNRIWKIDPDGNHVGIISSAVFTSIPDKFPFRIAGLNGIDYHPDGFLIVVHTWSGALFKVSLDGSSVVVVKAPLVFGGDGIALLSPDKLVVAGIPGTRLLQSSDNWESARLIDTYYGTVYRFPSAVAIKDGKVFVNHMLGFYKFVIQEAIFDLDKNEEDASAEL